MSDRDYDCVSFNSVVVCGGLFRKDDLKVKHLGDVVTKCQKLVTATEINQWFLLHKGTCSLKQTQLLFTHTQAFLPRDASAAVW